MQRWNGSKINYCACLILSCPKITYKMFFSFSFFYICSLCVDDGSFVPSTQRTYTQYPSIPPKLPIKMNLEYNTLLLPSNHTNPNLSNFSYLERLKSSTNLEELHFWFGLNQIYSSYTEFEFSGCIWWKENNTRYTKYQISSSPPKPTFPAWRLDRCTSSVGVHERRVPLAWIGVRHKSRRTVGFVIVAVRS